MNNNILYSISTYLLPDNICQDCNKSNLEKSTIFKKIRKFKCKLCDYHNTKKNFSDYVASNYEVYTEPENLFSDRSVSYHNNSNLTKEDFKEIVLEILQEYKINKYHFCCQGQGIMYYQ